MVAASVRDQGIAYQKGHKGMSCPGALGVNAECHTGVCTCQNPSAYGIKPCAQIAKEADHKPEKELA